MIDLACGTSAQVPDGLAPAVAALKRDVNGIVADLGRLLAVDTSFPPGTGYEDFVDLVESLVAPLGFTSRRVLVPRDLWNSGNAAARGERVNLIASRLRGRPVASLYFHTDVVPAGEGWTRPPFALTVEGDKLFGRGAADMKGTMAAALAALRAAEAAGLELAYDVQLLFCTDEEGGLYPGIRYLAETGEIAGHLLNFNGQAAPRLYAGSFGSLDLHVSVQGRAAHSGTPDDGINAIEEALPLLVGLRELKTRVERRQSALRGRDGEALRSRLNVTAARGGAKGSSVPGTFEVTLNRRYGPEERFEDVLTEIERTIDGAVAESRLIAHRTEIVGHLAPVSDPLGPHWARWQSALAAGFGWPLESFRAYGSSTSSDMGWVQAAGVREILLGGLTRPGCGAHGPDEHTTRGDVTALATSILLYLSRDFETAALPENKQAELIA